MEVNNNSISSGEQIFPTRLTQFFVALILTACGVVAGYVTTIYGLKLDLAAKADSSVVADIDRKLTRIEVILEETVLTKDEFHRFGGELQERLDKLESRIAEP